MKGLADSNLEISLLAQISLDDHCIQESNRIFNNRYVQDHFGIIPTGKAVELKALEKSLYDRIAKRFVAVFLPAAEYETLYRITTICHEEKIDRFSTVHRTLASPGWMAAYGREAEEGLPPFALDRPARVESLSIRKARSKG